MGTNKLIVALFAIFSMISIAAMAKCPPRATDDPDCASGHCGRVNNNNKFNQWCIAAKLAGCPTMVTKGNENCYCVCSCVAADTLIAMADGTYKKIVDIEKGEVILTPNGNTKISQVAALTASDATGFQALKLHLSDKIEIVVSPNHVFLRANGVFSSADQLATGDQLQSIDGVHTIERIEVIERYDGMLYNLVINEESENRFDHLVVTNRLVSGDYVLQNEIDLEQSNVDLIDAKEAQ